MRLVAVVACRMSAHEDRGACTSVFMSFVGLLGLRGGVWSACACAGWVGFIMGLLRLMIL